MNLLDRTGVTTNPEYSDYTDDAERRRLVRSAVRIAGVERISKETGIPKSTVRRFIQTGRTTRDRWAQYLAATIKIATRDFSSMDRALPTSDEGRLRLYVTRGRRCKRCGARLMAKQRRWCSRCRSSSGAARSRLR
jgi:hypothetical protein